MIVPSLESAETKCEIDRITNAPVDNSTTATVRPRQTDSPKKESIPVWQRKPRAIDDLQQVIKEIAEALFQAGGDVAVDSEVEPTFLSFRGLDFDGLGKPDVLLKKLFHAPLLGTGDPGNGQIVIGVEQDRDLPASGRAFPC